MKRHFFVPPCKENKVAGKIISGRFSKSCYFCRMLKKISNIVKSTYTQVEQESLDFKNARSSNLPDGKVFMVAVLASIALVVIEYVAKDPGYIMLVDFLKSIGLKGLSTALLQSMEVTGNTQLHRLTYWISVIVVFYLIIPMVFVKFVFKENLRDYGFRLGNLRKDYSIYLIMLCIMLPLVYWMSTTKSFQLRYPFYTMSQGEHLYPNFWRWECLYFLQFVGVEFFFRGFMLHGTKRQMGFYSILFMVIPYCMIHFGKPMAESIAAIMAGVALGVLSLKSKSIVPGILIHFSVAITMDLAALYQKGYF